MAAFQDRLAVFLGHMNLTMQSFEQKANIAQGLGKRLTEKSYGTTFKRIADAFPQLNMDWLKTGHGEMLRQVPVLDMSRRNSDGDSLLDSIKILMNEPTVIEKVVQVQDKVCSLELQVQELNRIIESKDETIDSQRERIDELKERIAELKAR